MAVESAREIFEVHMPRKFDADPGLSASVRATYKFVLTGEGGGTWLVDLTRPPGVVREEDGHAECTLTARSSDFVDIVNGKLDGKTAVMMGKLRVAGALGLALKLGTLLESRA